MADKLFYWIKLKTDFFSEDEIDFLLSQNNGCEYVVLYQMLCLKTANTDGKLQKSLGEIIVPYDINKIVRDCKYFDHDTVTVALELYKQLGLIYIDENNVLTIANHEDMIGSETSGAKRIREWREKQKLLHCNTDVTQDVTSDVTQEIRDKSIEYRDKSIDNREEENRDKESRDKRKNNVAVACVSSKQINDEFERLWEQYPNKKGKTKALSKYTSLRKNNKVTYEQVENGIINYIFYIREKNIDLQYIKNGSTWFNQECWNDDYTVFKKQTTNNPALEVLMRGDFDDEY